MGRQFHERRKVARMKTTSWSPLKILLVAFLAMALSWGPGKNASGGTQQEKGSSLSAGQVLAQPDLLHQRLRAGNPWYNGKAQFVRDPVLGLAADFSQSGISDLSPLAGIPFNALDLRGQPVSDLSPLKGMPLRLLGIEDTRVTDLKPLAGMKLEKLYLNNTPVSDARPLARMPLKELMLVGTGIQDLTPLKGSPVQSLWLNNTQVSDISPLAGCRIVSLTLEGTRVSDLKPLSRMTSLKRLHIGGTPVSDLTPLEGLRLERLVFTPGNIKKGLGVARGMKSLREVGTSMDVLMPPRDFWSRQDRRKGGASAP
jgi:internalin A